VRTPTPYAVRGEDADTYYRHIADVLNTDPHFTMDDGADLVSTLHRKRPELIAASDGKACRGGGGMPPGAGVRAGTEETTTGVIRLRAMAADGALRYPIVAVNDARTKHWFDNRYGTGQSTIDGLLRATNRLIAGSVFVVVGYGWVGRGIASRAAGMGGRVFVVEADPLRALEAAMDGFYVTDMDEAAAAGDFLVTATGGIHAIDEPHFQRMKDGAILANSGHFNVEINLEALASLATETREARAGVTEYVLPSERRLYVVGDGRLVNLAAAEGHPAAVMDMSFANQALVLEWLATEAPGLDPGVYPVPEHIDRGVAELKLKSLGMKLQSLTQRQKDYLASWKMGTE